MVTQTQAGAANKRAGAQRIELTAQQRIWSVIIGILFWFAAALAVKFGAAAGLFAPATSALMFALGVPLCWASVTGVKQVLRLQPGQVLPSIAAGLIAATLCDGIALTWVRGLYGTDPAQIVRGAAWILWGVGLFLLFAFSADRRRA